MIETLFATIIGFLGSIIPEIFKSYNENKDREHEARILEMQLAAQKDGHFARLEEIGAMADMAEESAIYATYKTGVEWVDALNGTVRPIITYLFFMLFAGIKFLTIVSLFKYGLPLVNIIPGDLAADALPWQKMPTIAVNPAIWGSEDTIIFATIISFYFGQRAMGRIRESFK